jgi:lysyl-tRNA synthetase class II
MMEDLKLVIESTLLDSLDNESVAYLLEVGDRYGAHRLKRTSLELICASKDTWDIIKATKSFSELVQHSPQSLLREIDYRCSKANLSKPGEVIRMLRLLV